MGSVRQVKKLDMRSFIKGQTAMDVIRVRVG